MDGTTRAEIVGWWARAVEQKASWLIVVADTFSYENYPVFVIGDAKAFYEKYDRIQAESMTRVMEVYDLSKPLDPQIADRRTNNLPARQ